MGNIARGLIQSTKQQNVLIVLAFMPCTFFTAICSHQTSFPMPNYTKVFGLYFRPCALSWSYLDHCPSYPGECHYQKVLALIPHYVCLNLPSLINPREFMMSYAPYKAVKGCSADIPEIRSGSATMVLKWNASFKARVTKIRLDALGWIATCNEMRCYHLY